jgi:hypothetical protein
MKIQIKVLSILVLVLVMMFSLAACGSVSNSPKPVKSAEPSAYPTQASGVANGAAAQGGKANALPDTQSGNNEEVKVKVTVGDKVLTATLLDNATTRSLIAKFPLTVPMQELYSREMCYRFPDALPANEEQTSGYEVGDISYWTPRHSFVIFYKQNGEVIGNLQKIGRIDSGVEIFSKTGDANVRFELLDK